MRSRRSERFGPGKHATTHDVIAIKWGARPALPEAMPDQKKHPSEGQQNPNPNKPNPQQPDRDRMNQPGQQRKEDPKDPNKQVDIDEDRITQRNPAQQGNQDPLKKP